MEDAFGRKYKRVLEILPDVAECAQGKLVLVGGTALALFHLKHRVSVDLDFVPANGDCALGRSSPPPGGDDVKLKEGLKGCMTKKGYRTTPGRFKNQFVVQFEDTSIKVEIFIPGEKVKLAEGHAFGARAVKVASIDDIFQMKIAAYKDRREARDLFDIFCVLQSRGAGFGMVKKLVSTSGMPKNIEDIKLMAVNPSDAAEFQKVIS